MQQQNRDTPSHAASPIALLLSKKCLLNID
jgi:hypothetical protein